MQKESQLNQHIFSVNFEVRFKTDDWMTDMYEGLYLWLIGKKFLR
jgi:hypothetical protein